MRGRTRHGISHRRRLYRAIVVRNGGRSAIANIRWLLRIVIRLLAGRPPGVVGHYWLGTKMDRIVHQACGPTRNSSVLPKCVQNCHKRVDFILGLDRQAGKRKEGRYGRVCETTQHGKSATLGYYGSHRQSAAGINEREVAEALHDAI